MSLIIDNLDVYLNALNKHWVDINTQAKYIGDIKNMRIVLERRNLSFVDLSNRAKTALLDEIVNHRANQILGGISVEDVWSASVPVKFNTDGRTIVDI